MNTILQNRSIQIFGIIVVAALAFVGLERVGPRPDDPAAQARVQVAMGTPETDSRARRPAKAGHSAISHGASISPIPAPGSPPADPAASLAPSTVSVKPQAAPVAVVHVAGMVRRPGVYTLPATSRVWEAVRLAGEVRPDGDASAVNLAARIEDGEQIYIPPRGAAAVAPAAGRRPVLAIAPVGRAPLAGPFAGFAMARTSEGTGQRHSASARAQKLTDPAQGTVDLNTAPAEQLLRLPGVGPSTAAKILDFRKTNGRFTSVEDIMNVKGIGPAKFAKMQPFLSVK